MAGDERWHNYYARGVAPWDSGAPASQLMQWVAARPEGWFKGKRVLELGCGTGASCVYLAEQGAHVTGVDLVHGALELARKRAAEHSVGAQCDFVEANVFQPGFVADHGFGNAFDFVFDCQFYHVFHRSRPSEAAALLTECIKPGGWMLSLTGNANEPEVGPAVLTEQEIREAFPKLELAALSESRFDMTQAYAKLERCPLCWVGVFQKPIQPM
eukprot:m.19732 g.19732  ORF g.19732 m.19732 type:complete len:214 (+) comp3770_c0_seq1:42-683(+)